MQKNTHCWWDSEIQFGCQCLNIYLLLPESCWLPLELSYSEEMHESGKSFNFGEYGPEQALFLNVQVFTIFLLT